MDASYSIDDTVSRIAGAIGEPARTRMLFSLMDGLAKTSTELAMVAEVAPSTASVHLNRLKMESLVKVRVQGKHRYYCLGGPSVARALERLSVLAGDLRPRFISRTPDSLRIARTCYDHAAGTLAVSLHERFLAFGWIESSPADGASAYGVTRSGVKAFQALGIDVESASAMRRRFAYGCLDWSERRLHLGGAMGAALLKLLLARKWLARDQDSRALYMTRLGQREMRTRFGLES
jgi:DNA-binding transcriptional ArsR family regulator